MSKTKKFCPLLVLPFLSFGLFSCQSEGENGKSSVTSSDSGNYYNEQNFVQSDKVVEKTKLVTYEGPSILKSSEDVSISVNGNSLFVYETRVNHARVFSWTDSQDKTYASIFDFEGKVHVEIKIKKEGITVHKAVVRPLVYGYAASVSDNVISFDLQYNGNYIVEYNDDPNTAIHLFANGIEEDPITEEEAAKDPNILYVGPGAYKADAFPLKSNMTIYLAGGAYVYGQFGAEGLHDITIRGRGIVSGSLYKRGTSSEYTIPVVMRRVNNLTIKDVAFFDPAGWTLHLWKCKNVLVSNVKIISARSNGDGISIQSCEDVEVSGGYVRTWDDSVVVKNDDKTSTANVHVHDVTIWTDLAQSMEVGYETYGPKMDNIIFENITVVHNFHKAVISLHNCDDANITNVVYRHINLEDGEMLGDNREDGENDFLLDFTIAYNAEWTKSKDKRGSVDGVTVEDVKVYSMSDTIGGRMQGEDDVSSIKNVKIKGLEIEGKQVDSKESFGAGLVTNEYVKNLSFEKLDSVLGARITLPYRYEGTKDDAEVTQKVTQNQEGLIVPAFSRFEGEPSFIGEKASPKTEAISSAHGAGIKTNTPADDGTGPFVLEGHDASKAFDGDSSTSYRSGAWKGETDEFASITYEFSEPLSIGTIRIVGEKDNIYALNYSIQVYARKRKSTGEMNEKFTRLLSKDEYAMSPSSGNIIDINVSAQEFQGIQLRLYRTDDIARATHYSISEIEFYPPSLTFMKSIVDSTEHNDVYNVQKVVDGDPTGTSYYESKSLPAHIVIDLGDLYKLQKVVLSVPPALTWGARTQKITLLASDSALAYDAKKTEFKVIKEETPYLFDPTTGNRNIIDLDGTACRYLKLVISSNDASGNYGAQLSEISAYGAK